MRTSTRCSCGRHWLDVDGPDGISVRSVELACCIEERREQVVPRPPLDLRESIGP